MIKKTLNPEWDEHFEFPIADANTAELLVHVKDHDSMLRSTALGEVKIDRLVLLDQTEFPLSGPGARGTLGLVCELVDKDGAPILLEEGLEPVGAEGTEGADAGLADDEADRVVSVDPVTPHPSIATPSDDTGAGTKDLPLTPASAESERPGVLKVTVLSAKELMAANTNGFSDPYVSMTCENTKHKTKHIKRTLNPEWRETFAFPVANARTAEIVFNVKDYEMLGLNQPLGSARLPVSELGAYTEHKLALEGYSGELAVGTQFIESLPARSGSNTGAMAGSATGTPQRGSAASVVPTPAPGASKSASTARLSAATPAVAASAKPVAASTPAVTVSSKPVAVSTPVSTSAATPSVTVSSPVLTSSAATPAVAVSTPAGISSVSAAVTPADASVTHDGVSVTPVAIKVSPLKVQVAPAATDGMDAAAAELVAVVDSAHADYTTPPATPPRDDATPLPTDALQSVAAAVGLKVSDTTDGVVTVTGPDAAEPVGLSGRGASASASLDVPVHHDETLSNVSMDGASLYERDLDDGRPPRPATLRLHVVRATGLRAANANASSDPYVSVQVEGGKHKTRHIKKTLTPEWDEHIDIPLKNANIAVLHCSVKDYERFARNQALGNASVRLDGVVGERELTLMPPGSGTLTLRFEWLAAPLAKGASKVTELL